MNDDATDPAPDADLGIKPADTSVAKAILISAVAALGGFLFGFDSAVINGAIDAFTNHYGLSEWMSGFAVAVALLGAAVGAWFAGPIADHTGRIRAMVIASVLFVISAVGTAFAFTEWDFMLWRAVGGAGIGMASVIAPAYIAEIAPAHMRGRLASLQQLAIVSGIFVALMSDAFLVHLADGASSELWFGLPAWRWMFLVGVLPSIIYGVLAVTVPESPRYLVAKGERDEAGRSLRQVLTGASPVAISAKVTAIAASLKREKEPSLTDLRGSAAGLRPIVWIGIFLSIFQQFVGINVIFYYSSTLWRSVGFSEDDALLQSVITSVTNIFVTVIAIALVDRIGRKPLLLIGSTGMTLSLGTMAVAFSQAAGTGENVALPEPYGTVALIAANAFVVFFGATWGPVVWVLLGEMFPNQIRAAALAVAAAAQWIANFTITMTFPWLASQGLSLAYGLYATFAAISAVFVWRAVSETKGRELEDMAG